MIDYIIFCLVTLISINTSDYAYHILTKKKFKFNIKIEIIYLILSIINTFMIYYQLYSIKLIYSYFLIYFPILIINKKKILKYKEQLNLFIIVYLLMNIFDLLTMLITNLLFPNINEILLLIINTIIIMSLVYSIFKIKYIQTIIFKIKYTMDNNKLIVITIITIFILTYFISVYDIFNEIDFELKIAILALIALTVVIILLMILNYNKLIDSQEYSQNLLDNIKGNELCYKNSRIEKHNINNYLLSLKSLSKENIDSSIEKYLKDTSSHTGNNYISKIPKSISGFVINKISKNKNCYIYGDEKIEDINIYNQKGYNELCKTLGIALDNAFRASKNCKDKNIYIGFIKQHNKLKISIVNNFNNNININKLGTFSYTTKDDGNGIGIYSLRKNKYVKYKMDIINDKFYFNIYADIN